MAYRIEFTEADLATMDWLSDHGYWPADVARDMEPINVDEDTGAGTYEIPEHVAWTITDLEHDDPDAFLACCSEPTLAKLVDLWQSIV